MVPFFSIIDRNTLLKLQYVLYIGIDVSYLLCAFFFLPSFLFPYSALFPPGISDGAQCSLILLVDMKTQLYHNAYQELRHIKTQRQQQQNVPAILI